MEERQFQLIINALISIRGNLSKIRLDEVRSDRTSVMYYLGKAYSDFGSLKTIYHISPFHVVKIDQLVDELIDEYHKFSNVADHYIDRIEDIDSLLDFCKEINDLINELDELLNNKARQ